MNKSSIALLALVFVALGFGVAASIYYAVSTPVELEQGLYFGERARALPAVELVDHRERPWTPDELRGNWSLMFFGYTHCPDICPLALQTLADTLRGIDDADVREAVDVYFVSVDPERDTPARLAEYVAYFDPQFVGLTAPLDRLRVLTRSLGIAHDFRNKTDGAERYDVDHSSAIVLINPAAEFAGIFGAPHDPVAMANDLTKIVEHN